MAAMRGVVPQNPSIVLLAKDVMDKCEVIADNNPGTILPYRFTNFSGSAKASDMHFSVDDLFCLGRFGRLLPTFHMFILAQVCDIKSHLKPAPPSGG